MLTKAGALYELCEFEHSLKFFTRAHFLTADSGIAKDGKLKCRKTILNRLEDEKAFSFQGASEFIDMLRKNGPGSTEKYLSKKGANMSLQCASLVGRKKTLETPNRERNPKKKGKSVSSRMRADREFLESLGNKIIATPQLEDNSVR